MDSSFRQCLAKYFFVLLIFPLAYTSFSTSYRNLHVQIYDQFASVFVDRRLSDDQDLKFAFIDIDETAYQTWGAKPVTPRQKLVELLKELERRAGKAKAIIVDIDTSYTQAMLEKACSDHPSDVTEDPPDRALCEWANNYQGSPPIILARFLEPRPDAKEGILVAPQHSILDRFVNPGLKRSDDHSRPTLSRGIHWATPSVAASVKDGVIRSWSLWQDVCHNGEPLVMPSVQLLSFLALWEGPSQVVDDVVDGLNANRPTVCNELRAKGAAPVVALEDGRELDLGEGWRSQRILYSIPWTDSSEILAPAVGDHPSILWPWRLVPTDAFSSYPATEIADLPSHAFDDRVIVIGASHQQARDQHMTPIGMMPGAVVLINAIRSLHAMGTIKEPTSGMRDLVTALVVLVLTGLMIGLNPKIAPCVACLAIAGATLLLLIFYPSEGHWIDVALAGALFFLLHAIVDLIERLCGWLLYDRRLSNPDLPSLSTDSNTTSGKSL
ncbi:MAG: CHASE2 domain-containing protein [Pseudomonadota bacterium]